MHVWPLCSGVGVYGVCMCTCMRTCAHTHLCICVGPRLTLDISLDSYLIHWGRVSPLNLKIIRIANLVSQLALGIPWLHHPVHVAYMEDLGIWTPVFMVLKQVLCPFSNLPRPYTCLIFNSILLITYHPLKWTYIHLLNTGWIHLINLVAIIHLLRKHSSILYTIASIIPGTARAHRATGEQLYWEFCCPLVTDNHKNKWPYKKYKGTMYIDRCAQKRKSRGLN